MLAWDGLSQERFFREYWRKKPILIKGGADRILDFTVDVPFFRRVCDRLERSPLELVIRRPGFIFAQKMDEGEPRFREVSRRYEELFTTKRAWFDGVYTTDAHTIGCHYDHSDNFVLQQSGTKHWKLAPPSMVPDSELRARMLEDSSVGHVFMPDDCEDFVVEPSDVLYIPLFWAHWGVSHGTAMSVSLVLNADSPLNVMLDPIRGVLSESRSWFMPLPTIVRPSEGSAPPPAMESRIDDLIEGLTGPEIRPRLRRAFWEELTLRREDEMPGAKASPYQRDGVRSDGRSIGLPIDRLEALAGLELPDLEPDDLLTPGPSTRRLLDHFSQRVLVRAIEVLAVTHGGFGDSTSWSEIVDGFVALSQGTEEEVLRRFRSPQVCAWLWRIAECAGFGYLPRFDEVVDGFAALCARTIARSSEQGAADIFDSDAWLEANYPRGRRYGGAKVDETSLARSRIREHLASLRGDLGKAAPALELELPELIRCVLPMRPSPDRPPHISIEPFFGLALFDPMRCSTDDLAYELGRTKARAIAAVGELFDSAERERVVSPFDGQTMSPQRLFGDLMGHHYRCLSSETAVSTGFEPACTTLQDCRSITLAGREFLDLLASATS